MLLSSFPLKVPAMGDSASSLAKAFSNTMTDKRIEVLRKIGETGSISQAARETGISYKAAWQAIDTLTNLTGVTLVEKAVGGVGGGGARLTDAGKQMLEIADVLLENRNAVLKHFQDDQTGKDQHRFSTLGIRTSMRNYLPCHVIGLKMNGQVVRVCLAVVDEVPGIVSRITRTSAELLGLEAGLPVIAMFKAMAVRVSDLTPSENMASANHLQGIVTRVSRGDSGDEITLELKPGMQVVGFAPSEKHLDIGDAVYATVDESAVVVALP